MDDAPKRTAMREHYGASPILAREVLENHNGEAATLHGRTHVENGQHWQAKPTVGQTEPSERTWTQVDADHVR